MNRIIIDLFGWAGAFEVLLAYFLISLNKIESKSYKYQLLNLTGAIFLIINTLYIKAYPSAFVNVVWVGVALYALLKKNQTT